MRSRRRRCGARASVTTRSSPAIPLRPSSGDWLRSSWTDQQPSSGRLRSVAGHGIVEEAARLGTVQRVEQLLLIVQLIVVGAHFCKQLRNALSARKLGRLFRLNRRLSLTVVGDGLLIKRREFHGRAAYEPLLFGEGFRVIHPLRRLRYLGIQGRQEIAGLRIHLVCALLPVGILVLKPYLRQTWGRFTLHMCDEAAQRFSTARDCIRLSEVLRYSSNRLYEVRPRSNLLCLDIASHLRGNHRSGNIFFALAISVTRSCNCATKLFKRASLKSSAERELLLKPLIQMSR